jgi:predicted MFS family arabinose efflux permease
LTGAILVTSGSTLLVFAISVATSAGWLAFQALGSLLAALVVLGCFVLVETRTPEPLINFSIFTRRAFTGATLISALFVATAGSELYILTLYMQQLLHFSPLRTGLAFLPMGLVVIIASNLVPNLVTRFGTKAGLIVANVLVIVGTLLLRRIGVQGNYWLDLLPGMLIFAAGAALIMVASAMAVTTVNPDEQGIASGVLNTAQQIGLALGLAISVASMSASQSALTAAHIAPEMVLAGGFAAGLLTNIVFVVFGAILSSILPVKDAASVPRVTGAS